MTETTHPPDAALIELSALINKQLPVGAQVNFFRIEHDDGISPGTGIVYQYGPQRATVRSPSVVTEHDAREIITAVNEWVAGMRYRTRWTEDPNEAA